MTRPPIEELEIAAIRAQERYVHLVGQCDDRRRLLAARR